MRAIESISISAALLPHNYGLRNKYLSLSYTKVNNYVEAQPSTLI